MFTLPLFGSLALAMFIMRGLPLCFDNAVENAVSFLFFWLWSAENRTGLQYG